MTTHSNGTLSVLHSSCIVGTGFIFMVLILGTISLPSSITGNMQIASDSRVIEILAVIRR